MDNGQELRNVIEQAKFTQSAALAIFNKGQARPLSESQWKAYLAREDSARRSPCPDEVLKRMKKLLKSALHGAI
ncbi:MAG: hypothetical protein Q7K26_02125 [bacterium]|nr:hypothetical protein [bacterium]